jgi:hypothetical protein
MERHQQIWDKTWAAVERAENAVRVVRDKKTGELLPVGEDVTAIAPLLNQAHRNIEILGAVTGEIKNGGNSGPSVAIQIVCPAAGEPGANLADDAVTIDIGRK